MAITITPRVLPDGKPLGERSIGANHHDLSARGQKLPVGHHGLVPVVVTHRRLQAKENDNSGGNGHSTSTPMTTTPPTATTATLTTPTTPTPTTSRHHGAADQPFNQPTNQPRTPRIDHDLSIYR